jgi:hypothetical protein
MHGHALCEQVLDLPDYDGPKQITFVPGDLWAGPYANAGGGFWYFFDGTHVEPEWGDQDPNTYPLETYTDPGFGSAGFVDANDPTSAYTYERDHFALVNVWAGPYPEDGGVWILAEGTVNLVKTTNELNDLPWGGTRPDPAGDPLKVPKINDVPGYNKCLDKPEGFITGMQEKAASFSEKIKQHRLEKWGSLKPPGQQ